MKPKVSGKTRIKRTESICLTAPGLTKALARRPLLRNAMVFSLAVAVLGFSFCSHAVTILSGPSFTPATNAPLAGTVQLTTDEAARVSVSVNDGYGSWQRNFYDFSTAHSVPLFGFKPARTNTVTVTVVDRYRNQFTADQPMQFVTGPLPTNFPNLHLLHSEPDRMEPGYTLFRLELNGNANGYATIVNSGGEVVWYGNIPAISDVRLLPNGHLFFPSPPSNNIQEIDLLGNLVKSWPAPRGFIVNHHDAVPTDHGTILFFNTANEVVSNYPTSLTVSNAPKTTATISYQTVVEISAADASLVNTWTPITVLDPLRITYLGGKIGTVWDSEHVNAVIEDPQDDSLIVSLRAQNAVIKISRATGQLKWILGPPANWGASWQPYLLNPVGTPFLWQYGQHAPVLTPQGNLLMFDNGNFRASPFATSVPDTSNYSRAVEYQINEDTMEVSQVWDYGRTNVSQRLYVDHEGNAEPEPQTGNVLIDFASVKYINGVAPSSYGPSAYIVRLTEVTHDETPQIVFDLELSEFDNPLFSFKGCTAYRAHRIPDLYAHPAQPVADLSVTCENGVSRLEFSADDTRTYVIEASTNLVDWEAIGVALEDEQERGNFSFEDDQFDELPTRYYRVVTQ
jgi:hypothetical protein